jgi:KRAB domain-containing zinc finger protein
MIACEYCNRSFNAKQALERHIKIIHLGEGKTEECDICEKTFMLKSDLSKHKSRVHREKNIKCEFKGCEKMFTMPSLMKKHYNRAHLKIKEKNLECDTCSAKFDTKSFLVDHIKSKHLNQKYVCNQCDKTFTTRYALSSHIQNIHHDFFCEFCDRRLSSKYSLDIHLKFDHMGFSKFKCETCERKFKSNSILRAHIRQVHGEKKFKCEYKGCEKIFAFLSDRKKHFDQVHLKIKKFNFECDICSSKYPKKLYLVDHIRSKHLNQKYDCNQCHSTFTMRHALSFHIKNIHQDFICEFCDQRFNSKQSLDTHLKFDHMGFSKFKCETCERKFKSNSILRAHIRQVHGEKKFKCEYKGCDRKFTFPSERKKHFDRVHLKIKNEKQLQCDLCPHKSVKKFQLIDHIESRHLGKKYNCKQCDTVFNARSTLYSHIRNKHKKFSKFDDLEREKISLLIKSPGKFSIKQMKEHISMFEMINFDQISNYQNLRSFSIILKRNSVMLKNALHLYN